VCTERGIALIFDEVFVGFRLAAGGAQEYFGVRADMVTYGKSLGGGLPVGVLCGRASLMKRFRDDRPGDICFARGTFNAHPYVMGAMDEFLHRLESPAIQALYVGLDDLWSGRAGRLNESLVAAGLPVRVANLSSIWTVLYTRPSRYNWMFQYYLRAEGLALSWVGTGRLIFSLNYTDADFEAVAVRFVAAAEAMKRDGWWWSDPAATNRTIKRRIFREMIAHRFSRPRKITASDRPSVLLPAHPPVDELALEKVQRRLVVELDVMKRVGDDLGHPHEPALHVLQEEQVDRAEQETTDRQHEPHEADMPPELAGAAVRLEDPEQGRVEIER
jgi:hypothetical protein